jgi:uncharacterized protein (DUF1800 family)
MTESPLFRDPARAWAPYRPGPGAPWDLAAVGHLHRRAGFSPPWHLLQRDLAAGPDVAVNRLFAGEEAASDGSTPDEFSASMDAMATQLAVSSDVGRIRGAWLYRMIHTPHPLRERMTLFWHDHFATSDEKVHNPSLMQGQNALFREHALGDFGVLLRKIGRDPAMLLWLDAAANRKARPNENYAREVMELFALGRGQYTEVDIREAARAFTGWFVVRDAFRTVDAEHDDRPKTLFGKTGAFGGDDIPPILLDRPACASFVCNKLFRAFVSDVDPPTPALIEPLAAAFRESGYQVAAPLRMILGSTLFHDPSMHRRRVKGPVEFTVGLVRSLEVFRPTVGVDALAEACSLMGQALFAPPSVAGWEGGTAWVDTSTMLARANFALALLSAGDKTLGGRCDPLALAQRAGAGPGPGIAGHFVALMAQDAFDPRIAGRISAEVGGKDEAAAARDVVSRIAASPEYQLA